MNIIYLPKSSELAPYLDKLPQDPNEYKATMKTLATSIKQYSEQIAQLFGLEEVMEDIGGIADRIGTVEDGDEDGE
jgi:hypothetical protein